MAFFLLRANTYSHPGRLLELTGNSKPRGMTKQEIFKSLDRTRLIDCHTYFGDDMEIGILKQAVDLLRDGDVIACKTDTVYGLIADATNEKAINKIYELKKRPKNKQLIVLVNSLDMANDIAVLPSLSIIKKYWFIEKRPTTIVLPKRNCGDTIAIRYPKDNFIIELITLLGRPIVAPSANISGHPTALSYEMVIKEFADRIPLIIDGGICDKSPSRIIDLTTDIPKIIRN